MSEENKNTETEVKTETKKSGLFGWVRNIVSAVVGAAISFGVTLGVVSADQEKELNARLNNINVKAEAVVTALQNKDVNTAIVKAQEIASETKVAIETAKEVVEETKEKVVEKTEEIKATAKKAKLEIKEAVKPNTDKQ
jgi:hypothetical protein